MSRARRKFLFGCLLAAAGFLRPPAAAAAWTDDPLTDRTPIKAVHFRELRDKINDKISLCRLSSMTWTWNGSSPAAKDPIHYTYLNDLRAAVYSLYSDLGLPTPSFTAPVRIPDPRVTRTPIKRAYITELRRLIDDAYNRSCPPGGCNPACRPDPGGDSCAPIQRCVNGRCVTGGAHCCFAAGTVISSPRGDIPIEKLSAGMPVYAMDPNGPGMLTLNVVKAHRRLSKEGVEVGLSDGRTVQTTAEHPFFDPSSRSYKPIRLFQVGDPVLVLADAVSGQTVELKIVMKKDIEGDLPVYNLSVGNPAHSFFANGILVHNKCWPSDGGGCN